MGPAGWHSCGVWSPPHESGEWLTEIKWDGARALMYVEDGRVRVRSRQGLDMTASFPEVQRLAGAVRGKRAVLDGELVAFARTAASRSPRCNGACM
ncbi:ATP-dependent DNA ligase [Nonomuraea sp. H19]|uniref:ATP-dependent DNA ligase n=1 Tax=Nonomuraea sp. H19 TaxID=3452206 RepID=UPI003F8A9D92